MGRWSGGRHLRRRRRLLGPIPLWSAQNCVMVCVSSTHPPVAVLMKTTGHAGWGGGMGKGIRGVRTAGGCWGFAGTDGRRRLAQNFVILCVFTTVVMLTRTTGHAGRGGGVGKGVRGVRAAGGCWSYDGACRRSRVVRGRCVQGRQRRFTPALDTKPWTQNAKPWNRNLKPWTRNAKPWT